MKKYWVILGLLLLPVALGAKGKLPSPRVPAVASAEGKEFVFRTLQIPAGGFFLLWTRQLADGSYQLLSARGDADLHFSWLPGGLPLASGISSSRNWSAVSDGGTGLILCWEQDQRLSFQRFNEEGHPLWPGHADAVNVSTFTQNAPVAAPDGSGGAYVVWEEERYAGRRVLMAQHVTHEGTSLWLPEGVRVCLRPTDQREPSIVPDGEGGALVAWKDSREQSSQLQAQRINARGEPLWGPEGILVTAPVGSMDRPPLLASSGQGRGILVWKSSLAGSPRLIVQSVSSDGKALWSPDGVEVSLGAWDKWNPVLHGDGEGGVWVGWEDFRDQGNWRVFVQYLRPDGKPVWTQEVPLAPVRGDQGRLTINDDGDKTLWTAWVDNRLGTPSIFAQSVTPDGQPRFGGAGVLIADHLVNPGSVRVIDLGPARAAVFWSDQDGKNRWSLYAQPAAAPH